MLIAIVALQAATLGATNYAADQPITAPARAPDLADEFSGDHIDPATWRFDVSRNRQGWPNHELQYYGPENARVVDGALAITARAERPTKPDSGGQAYTSAKLISRAAMG
ncbi:hypothetical protein LXJ56_26725, partial [Escherichia coli]|nr:hypothetical protein [Escherichia coli]